MHSMISILSNSLDEPAWGHDWRVDPRRRRDAVRESVVDDVLTRQRVVLRGAAVMEAASGRFRESRVKREASTMWPLGKPVCGSCAGLR